LTRVGAQKTKERRYKVAKHYSLEIKPAVHPEIRHKIEDILKASGFHVTGGGQFVDGASCDASFEKEENGNKNDRSGS